MHLQKKRQNYIYLGKSMQKTHIIAQILNSRGLKIKIKNLYCFKSFLWIFYVFVLFLFVFHIYLPPPYLIFALPSMQRYDKYNDKWGKPVPYLHSCNSSLEIILSKIPFVFRFYF